ncbi:MAG: glutamine amidotransferase [Cyanobacteria bacterium REEB459]|nr:glutamine amidotransferase [Cyanobacteria bacterium REEB459]
MTYHLTLTHLYPDHLNLYGDSGNLIVLKRRCQWMGIDCTVRSLTMGEVIQPGETDLYFMGGGQDTDQVAVVDDFHALKAAAIATDTEAGVVFLGVCGGYQLMGHTFLMGNGQETPGLGIINVHTRAPGSALQQRCIGNLVATLEPAIYAEMVRLYSTPKTIPPTLVGFENHSGQTLLGPGVQPLAKPIAGFGNNASGDYEGARYRNVFGSYMHGSLLPKNPHFADYLLGLALRRKYNDPTLRLPGLNDLEELAAHHYAVDRYGGQGSHQISHRS